MRHRYSPWKSSIRQLLPPPLYVVIAVLLVGGLETLWFGFSFALGPLREFDHLLLARDGLIVFLLTAYGIFRVMAFHPLYRHEYLEWLSQTPWCPESPLPLGPVRLAWPDLVIAGGMALLLEDPREVMTPDVSRLSAAVGLLAFLQAHTLALAFSLWLTRPRTHAYVVAFLLAVTMRVGMSVPLAGAAVLISASSVAHLGLRRSWHLFPWQEATDWWTRLKTGWKSSQQVRGGMAIDGDTSPDRVHPSELGWPFGVCSPYEPPQIIPLKEKLLLEFLAGFWLYAVLANFSEKVAAGIGLFLMTYGLLAVVITRLAAYGWNHVSPINFVGRVVTFRWIVRGHDARFLGPLSMLVVAFVGGLAGYFWLQVPAELLTPAVLTITLWTMTLSGPTPAIWKLTAPARLVPGRLNRNSFEELS